MPPPTVADPWLAARRFGIVIDAGSSGSRLQIYSWKDPHTIFLQKGKEVAHMLPKVEKGARAGEEWMSRIETGLSSYADNPEGVGEHLAPLLRHARYHIPPSLHYDTPLFLLATAGMRLLPPQHQADVLRATCSFLKLHSNFRIDPPSVNGPCGSSVRIITGEEEGLFGWIAVNYLMDGFTNSSDTRTTYGFLDMGGASTQIAFEPGRADRQQAMNLIDVRLRLLGGEEIHHEVFVTTWLGYGTNKARERYVGQAINEFEITRPEGSIDAEIIPDPCLPKNLQLTESPVHKGASTPHNDNAHTLRGTGSFEQCLQKTSTLLNKQAPCPDSPCLFNGVYVPPIDFSVSHFIGVSEYWYSSEHVFGLGGPYNFVQYERAASEFCGRDWDEILEDHKLSSALGTLGGDGEVEEGGQIVETGKWGKEVEISRLEMQCFKAAWVTNVLHEGIGMPRIVDPGGNISTGGNKVAEQAERKGLGRPTFQSIESVDDIAISWTLGKMVLEASKEVPLPSPTDQPLGDPLDNMPETVTIRPIRPPFLDFDAFEDRISHHLPSSLKRTSLGFSPILFLFYATLLCVVIFVSLRLRHLLTASCRRLARSNKRAVAESYALEEGIIGNGHTSNLPPTPPTSFSFVFLNPLRRLFSNTTRPRPPPLTNTFTQKGIRNGHPVPLRLSPIRSHSLPNGYSSHTTASSSTQYLPTSSSSPSPSPSLEDNNSLSNSLASLSSRSRNASQINLTTLVPRQGNISRVNSMLHIPSNGSFHDDSE